MTRKLMVGNVQIGGGAPVAIQSMCSVHTTDVDAVIAQINAQAAAGCDITRLAVPDMDAALCLGKIKKAVKIPIVADIHFDWRLAIESIKQGVDKVRINPGNIGSEAHVREVADACRLSGVPIRVGVNGGSLEKRLVEKYGVTPEALCESALENIAMLEKAGFYDICVSVKASSVKKTIEAYRLVSKACPYPLHLGVTEAGTPRIGILKAAAAFGSLLSDGIGDTLRVTLTADPVEEIYAAKNILNALGMNETGVNLVSCPTCGRTNVDLIPLVEKMEKRLAGVRSRITVAIMGCVVNGPGEAREADLGVACGKGEGLIFIHGKPLKKVPEAEIPDALAEQIRIITGEEI